MPAEKDGDGGNRRADVADMGEVPMACGERADPRAAADADVENAGVDGHGNGRSWAHDESEELRLEQNVVECRDHATNMQSRSIVNMEIEAA